MKISLKTITESKQSKYCLILGIYEDGSLTKSAEMIDKKAQGYITQLLKSGFFNGKFGQFLPSFQVGKEAFNLLLIGVGKKEKLTASLFRKLLAQTAKQLINIKIKQAICYLTDVTVKDHDMAWKVKQSAEALYEGCYRFDLFQTDKAPLPVLEEIILPVDHETKALKDALASGIAVAHGVNLTKNLANLPSNICTPDFLAEEAKALAKSAKLKINILNEKEMQKLGMGALLAVSQGSAEEAKLIVLEYRGGKAKQKPVALVGKGITFDTGGNSLKSPENMVGMKYDMCGAATVLGTLKAVAELQLPINVVGIIAAVENMPGGTAYKPEDILTSLSGKTIEVISTDAEGRLILADALTYCERFNPEVVIDIATLTGAVVIALGFHATGLLTNNEALAKDLLTAGQESHDRAWQLPLWDEFQEQIKSPFADMANTGGRSAGTITAACFLSRFTEKFAWAHLDVAGTAAMMMGTQERMATGRPVPLLVQYLINRC